MARKILANFNGLVALKLRTIVAPKVAVAPSSGGGSGGGTAGVPAGPSSPPAPSVGDGGGGDLATPLPAAAPLFLSGLLGMGYFVRRRKKTAV
jgi:uncharacterized membrane protein